MVSHRQSSKLALRVMRMMGWFPYRWVDNSVLHLTVSDSTGNGIPRSWPWVVWSLGMGIISMAVCGTEAYLGFRCSTVTTIPTLQVTRSLYDVFRGVMGVIMCLYTLFYSPRLAQAISHADQVCRDFDLRGTSAREVFIMFLIIVTAVLVILLCSMELEVAGAFTPLACVQILAHVFKNVLIAMVTILYNNCINVLTLAYSRATEKIEGHERSAQSEEKKTIHSISVSEFEVHGELPLTEDDLHKIGRHILQLQAFHHRLNEYFAPVVVLTVAMSMFTCILTLFHVSLFQYLWWKGRIFTCIYLFLGTQPLLTLTNMTHALNTKKEDLLRALAAFRSQGAAAVQDLESLTRDFPNFSMCGFFSLHRTLIVNIFSFIATYVIILIQFHVGKPK